jgi:hypothetical protein
LGVGRWALIAGFPVFVVVATANGAGYRYGTSDQAFYIPSVVRALDPAAFPRDASLIDSQGKLMVTDEALAAIIRLTGMSPDVLFFAAYVASLLVIWLAVTAIGRRLYSPAWLTAALAAAFTLRHQIPRTSANSFEPYFHPRMLAFGVGAMAVAAVLQRRMWAAAAFVGLSGLVHTTTGLWFAVVVGVAIVRLDRAYRPFALSAGVAAATFLVWAGLAGPLQGSFVTMDPAWIAAIAAKDTLFATDWPIWAWLANLSLIVIAWFSYRVRRRTEPELSALIWGAAALVAVFVFTLPLVRAELAFFVQLQIPRVFWIVDFVALLCLIGLARRERTATILAAFLVAVAVGRGVYIMGVEHPERRLVTIRLPSSEWEDAMQWIKARPGRPHVLADPGHAWKYGTSVRVSAERDVFLEEVKDSAIAIYSRDVAVRYNERVTAIGDFAHLSVDSAVDLAARYDLDYLVAETAFPLPVAYRNARFTVYLLQQ